VLSYSPFKNRVTTVYGPFGYRYLLTELDSSAHLSKAVYEDPKVEILLDKIHNYEDREAELEKEEAEKRAEERRNKQVERMMKK